MASAGEQVLDLAAAGRAVDLWHAEVQQDELVCRAAFLYALLYHVKGFLAVAAKVSMEVELLQQASYGDDVEGAVVADQNLVCVSMV